MIGTKISGFNHPYSALNDIESINVRPISLAWAMVSLGNTGWRDFFKGQRPDYWGCIELIASIMRNTTMENGFLRTSNRYRTLSDTDLATASYRLGAALSKYVSWKTIGTIYLQDALPLIREGIVLLNPYSNRRPDYIGLDKSGNWHSLESKGRSNNPGHIINTAKAQAKVVSIHGKPPKTNCVSISHLYKTPIHVDFSDPDSFDDEDIEITIDERGFISKYYAAFDALVNRDIEYNISEMPTNKGLVQYIIPSPSYFPPDRDFISNLRYGISLQLFELLYTGQITFERVFEVVNIFDDIEPQRDNSYIAPDGTIIYLE